MKKILNVWNGLSKPLKATIFYILIIFFQSGINLITTPLFSRMLSTEEFGVVTTYNSWYNLLSIFITLNLSSGVYNNALLDFEKNKEKMTSSFLSLSITLSIIFSIIYCLFYKTINNVLGLPSILCIFMILNFITYPAWGFFIAKEKFDYKYIKPLIITIITFLFNPIFGVLFIYLFPEFKAIAKIIGCQLPTLISSFILLIIIYKKGKTYYKKDFWKYALSFNIPLLPHYLSGVILSSSDRIMIQKIINYSAAGIYGISYQLSLVVQGVFSGINSALIPYTYKHLKSQKENKISSYVCNMLYVIIIISILLCLFTPEIVCVLAPKEYYGAIWVIPPIILGLYFSFVASLYGNIEFYYKKNKYVTVATCTAAIVNIVLNYIFIPKYGFIAAGYTTFIGYLILYIIHYLFVKKINKLYIYNNKRILVLSVIEIIIVSFITLMYNNLLIRYLFLCSIIIMCLIYKNTILKVLTKMKEDKDD